MDMLVRISHFEDCCLKLYISNFLALGGDGSMVFDKNLSKSTNKSVDLQPKTELVRENRYAFMCQIMEHLSTCLSFFKHKILKFPSYHWSCVS